MNHLLSKLTTKVEGLVALTHRNIEMFMADECGGECREMSGCWDEWDGMNGMGCARAPRSAGSMPCTDPWSHSDP